MRAGALRQVATIQQNTPTRDAYGGEIPAWTTFASVRAEKKHQSSREFFAAQKLNSEVTDLYVIRYRSGVTTLMRLVVGSSTYDIIGAPDPDGRRREIHLLCKLVS